MNVFDIGDAALGQCLPKPRIGPGHFPDQSYVIQQNAGPNAGNVPPVDDLICDEIDPRFPNLAISSVEGTNERFAWKRRSRAETLHRAFFRFVQRDGLEHHARSEIVLGPNCSGRAANLARRQRI